MKFELIATLIAATSVTTVAAPEEEILYGERNLSRLESRRIKDNGKASKKYVSSSSSSSYKSKSSKVDYNGMYLLPFGCPGKCVQEEYKPGEFELEEAILECDLSNAKQEWMIHYYDEIMKFEGYEMGYCIGVDNACDDSKLSLVHCDEPESEWYFTGGKLISGFCWSHRGQSKVLSVDSGCAQLELSDTVDPEDMFMLVGQEFIATIPGASEAPSLSLAPSLSPAPSPE